MAVLNMDITNLMDYEDDTDNASETQIVTWKTLIDVVRANPILYEKNHKGYNKKSDKILMCNCIGKSLVPPMTGKCRQRQCKIRALLYYHFCQPP